MAGEIWLSFSSHKISLCSKSPHFGGATFWTTLVMFIDRNPCAMKQSFSHLGKTGCSASGYWFKFIGVMWSRQSILFRKNIENCSMLPHLTVYTYEKPSAYDKNCICQWLGNPLLQPPASNQHWTVKHLHQLLAAQEMHLLLGHISYFGWGVYEGCGEGGYLNRHFESLGCSQHNYST